LGEKKRKNQQIKSLMHLESASIIAAHDVSFYLVPDQVNPVKKKGAGCENSR
jgi:hypothetical protein